MAVDPATAAVIRQLQEQVGKLQSAMGELVRRPRSITDEIDALPGRRILYTLGGEQTFTTAQNMQSGAPIAMTVSQDGNYVWTHYPLVTWWPSGPSNATNFGRHSIVNSFPVPAQQLTNFDSIDIEYTIADAGSQRLFQNTFVSGGLLSRPGELMPLPVPTVLAPNAVVTFTVTYLNINFVTGTEVNTTQGTLHVDLPGYRIVNL